MNVGGINRENYDEIQRKNLLLIKNTYIFLDNILKNNISDDFLANYEVS
jgi:hypothetical protein